MQAETYAEIHDYVGEHHDALMRQWFDALTEIGHASLNAAPAQQTLKDVVEQLIRMVCADAVDPAKARAIGGTIASLSENRVEVVTATLELLTRYLLDALPAVHCSVQDSRLSELLAAVTGGIIERLQSQSQSHYEQTDHDQSGEIAELSALFRARQRYCRAIVTSVPLMLLVIDRAGVIKVAEGKALRRLNFACANIVGQSIFEVADKLPDLLEHTVQALTGQAFITVIEVGEAIFEVRYEPNTDEHGRLIGTIAVAHDVTLRTKREMELLRMRRRAAQETTMFRQHIAQVLETGVVKQLQNLQARIAQLYAGNEPMPQQGTAAAKHVSANLDQVYQSVLALVSSLGEQQSWAPVPTLDVHLTREEQAALELLISGQSNREMAVALNISTKAVEKRLSKLYAKLGVMTRAEAIVLGIRAGLV
jgi:DNA-binding NarL/FixJ family response regulator/PAS domain-containing protein